MMCCRNINKTEVNRLLQSRGTGRYNRELRLIYLIIMTESDITEEKAEN